MVTDVDGDGSDEIVTAHGSGWVSVYSSDLLFEAGWPQQPVSSELRSLAVGDLDGDGTKEIALGAARGSNVNAWVLEHTGTVRPGWPQVGDGEQYSWGIYNDNLALADLDRNGSKEVVAPSDVHYIAAYGANGTHLPANATFGAKNWGQVGVWENYAVELRGWGQCDGVRSESYRTNYADGPATVADLDQDGALEVVVTGTAYDCSESPYLNRYNSVHVFDADRSRYQGNGYDWTTTPTDLGLPLSQDYNVIESAVPNPVVADLDGDGEKEILFADFSGKVHAIWLDGTEHGSWPYSVYDGGEVLRFASEPVVADLDRDGSAEVLFGSWVEKGSGLTGYLHVVSAAGTSLHQIPLPVALSGDWNGALAAPTLANLDSDSDLEVVLQTRASGVVAFDLPGTSAARILWGTGRGSYLRSGVSLEIFMSGFEGGDTGSW